MWTQVLSVTLCLCLLAPPGGAAEAASQPSRTEDVPSAGSAMDREAGQRQPPAPPRELSSEEEAALAARAEEPGPEVSGGALSNLHLTYAVIALAAIVLVLLVK